MKNIKTIIQFIILSASILFLFSCSETQGGDYNLDSSAFKFFEPRKAIPLNDLNLTGTFSLYECDPDCNTWNKSTRYTALYFYGNSYIGFYQKFTTITSEKHTNIFLELFVENGQHRERLWSDDIEQENKWSDLQNYNLTGNVLTLTGFQGETYILNKEVE